MKTLLAAAAIAAALAGTAHAEPTGPRFKHLFQSMFDTSCATKFLAENNKKFLGSRFTFI